VAEQSTARHRSFVAVSTTNATMKVQIVTVEFAGDLGSGLRRGKPTALCS
jgi:hypothetical protein